MRTCMQQPEANHMDILGLLSQTCPSGTLLPNAPVVDIGHMQPAAVAPHLQVSRGRPLHGERGAGLRVPGH
jgi:hypothetical protein